MPLPPSKFMANTEVCFDDFLSAHPGLKTVELLAEFCLPEAKGAVASIQAWQRRTVKFPRGEALLRLRCFLTLAGYEVEEFSQLERPVRQLGMLISMNHVSPQSAALKLGYDSRNGSHSIWRITLGKGSFTTRTRNAMTRLLRSWESRIAADMDQWRERIVEITGAAPEMEVSEAVQDVQDALMPIVATGFGRLVATLTPMAQAFLEIDQSQAVRDATRDGASIDELITILTELRGTL